MNLVLSMTKLPNCGVDMVLVAAISAINPSPMAEVKV